MRFTKIYWKRFSRPACFLAGLTLSASASAFYVLTEFYSSEPLEVEPREEISVSELAAGLYIESYRYYPNSVPDYSLRDADGNSVKLEDIRERGVRVVPSGKCELFVIQGEQRETVTCTDSLNF